MAEEANAEIRGSLLIENEGWRGVFLHLSSSLTIIHPAVATIRGNADEGIVVSDNSTVTVDRWTGGKIVITNNSSDGIMANRNSLVQLYNDAQISNNGRTGVAIYGNSTGFFGRGTVIQGNSSNGLNIVDDSMLSASGILVENNSGKGIFADNGSTLNCNNSIITGNTGGDVDLSFGSRATLNGNTIATLPISCDETVLSRGDTPGHLCPSP